MKIEIDPMEVELIIVQPSPRIVPWVYIRCRRRDFGHFRPSGRILRDMDRGDLLRTACFIIKRCVSAMSNHEQLQFIAATQAAHSPA